MGGGGSWWGGVGVFHGEGLEGHSGGGVGYGGVGHSGGMGHG